MSSKDCIQIINCFLYDIMSSKDCIQIINCFLYDICPVKIVYKL